MTASEADEKWGLKKGTVRSSCVRGPLKKYIAKGLVRKSGSTWLVNVQAMKEVYGGDRMYDKIVRTIKNWGYNEGELEEIIVQLAEHAEDSILSANARVCEDEQISYELTLTKKGVQLYENWCSKNDLTPMLTGNGNVLLFADQNKDSVQNTLEEWKNRN